MRSVTLQQPVAAEADGGRDARKRVGHVSGGASAGFGGNSGDPTAETPYFWVPVRDEASGHTFFWNTVSGATTWTKPSPAQFVASRLPWRIETAGASRTPIGGSREEAGPLVKVVHNIVWERCMRMGCPPVWRIAKL